MLLWLISALYVVFVAIVLLVRMPMDLKIRWLAALVAAIIVRRALLGF